MKKTAALLTVLMFASAPALAMHTGLTEHETGEARHTGQGNTATGNIGHDGHGHWGDNTTAPKPQPNASTQTQPQSNNS